MKTYGGVDVSIHIFLTSVLVGGEWSASRSLYYPPLRGKERVGGPQGRSDKCNNPATVIPIFFIVDIVQEWTSQSTELD
jgi:hypothetical protein